MSNEITEYNAEISGISGGSSIAWQTISANFAASASDALFVDTSAGQITITLPTSPITGNTILLQDPNGSWSTNAVYVFSATDTINNYVGSIELNASAEVIILYNGTNWVLNQTPTTFASLGSGNIYITASFNNTFGIFIFDSTDLTQISTVSATNSGNNFAATNNFIYLVADGENAVYVIDKASTAIVDTITGFDAPVPIAISGTKAYVASYNNPGFWVVDLTTNSIIDNISAVPAGNSIAIYNGFAYVANTNNNTVTVVDLSSNAITSTITGLNGPINILETNNKIYVLNQNDTTIAIIDPIANSVTGTITVAQYPQSMATDGTNLYVSTGSTNYIYVVKISNNTVVSTFSSPGAQILGCFANKLYVSSFYNGNLVVYNTADNSTYGSINNMMPAALYVDLVI